MAENILHDFQDRLTDGVTLVPSGGGVFEISLGDEAIFSKKRLDRFPNENEVEGRLEELLAG